MDRARGLLTCPPTNTLPVFVLRRREGELHQEGETRKSTRRRSRAERTAVDSLPRRLIDADGQVCLLGGGRGVAGLPAGLPGLLDAGRDAGRPEGTPPRPVRRPDG